MHKAGYNRTVVQCCDKVKKLKSDYRKNINRPVIFGRRVSSMRK